MAAEEGLSLLGDCPLLGHSWKKFWKSFVGAVIGAVATVLLGPAGFALVGATMAGIIGGAVGGAVTGALEGGWKGALFGALGGGALGGIGAWGIGQYGWQFGVGMLVVGGGVAAATDSWDSFAGGLAGGILGGVGGNVLVKSEQFQNMKAGNGFKANRDVKAAQWEKFTKEQHALNVDKSDKIKVEVVARYLKDPDSEISGTMATVRHRGIRGDGIGFDMGPVNGKITTATDGSTGFDTFLRTSEYLSDFSQAVKSVPVEVSRSGLANMIQSYGKTWGGDRYLFYNYNSNYAVNTIIYGAGGQVPENLGWTYQGK